MYGGDGVRITGTDYVYDPQISLGGGSQASVFKGKSLKNRREVAVKIITVD